MVKDKKARKKGTNKKRNIHNEGMKENEGRCIASSSLERSSSPPAGTFFSGRLQGVATDSLILDSLTACL
jgi:hypothetical protein